ncbi:MULTISPECIES: Cro/CI family transcriptional regulator [Serratia]|uniref:Cro/CI family transcriptional regulator n=1 Tax=Serratia TaxID=613 RepID=UPI001436DCCD|nr:Cro/CI family transcriptional regulator [Serratia marcescens]MBN3978575.1 helix-turn-helix domain-containing protein [Serratia marcescens]QHJ76799.1 MAG: hypothetical protein [Bacteriophage sp.]
MLKEAATEHFGSQHAIALALGVSDSAVSQWKEIIPEKAALKLSILTKGKLKYLAEFYKKAA